MAKFRNVKVVHSINIASTLITKTAYNFFKNFIYFIAISGGPNINAVHILKITVVENLNGSKRYFRLYFRGCAYCLIH